MKRIVYVSVNIWVAGIVFSLSSCMDEILNKEPLDSLADNIVWNSEPMVDSYLATQYMLSTVMLQESPSYYGTWAYAGPLGGSLEPSQNGYGPLIINNIADEGKAGWDVAGGAGGYKSNGINIGGGFLEWWDYPYYICRNLNSIIEKLPEGSLSDDYKTLRLAEARFLRAFNYFAMVKRYGAVPLLKKAPRLNDPDEILYPKRNPEKEVYDFIIGEMDDIAEPLSATTDFGRPTQWAALALKCRAALYAGSIAQFGKVQLDGLLGIPAGEASDYYRKAYDAAQRIMANTAFDLYNADADKTRNFRNIFMKKKHSEVILAIAHNNVSALDASGNTWSYDFCQRPKPHGWDCGMGNTPYLEMAEEFEYIDGRPGTLDRTAIQQGLWSLEELWGGKDPRFSATLYTMGSPWNHAPDKIIDFHNGIIGSDGVTYEGDQAGFNGVPARGTQNLWGSFHTGFGVMKYLDEDIPIGSMWSDSRSDYLVFRLGEVLLNYAEAAFELGKPDDALAAVNRIRERAGISKRTSVDREAIRHERKVELAFEGHRYWDLRRWREAVGALTRDFSGIRYILDYDTRKYKLVVLNKMDGDNSPKFFERNYYFPVTLGRTGANSNLVENPGYE